MRAVLVAIQAASFVALGVVILRDGDWRLGVAQFLLAGVTAVVYL
jgi:hypothetical protein